MQRIKAPTERVNKSSYSLGLKRWMLISSVVLQRQCVLLILGTACADIMTPGGLKARHLSQRRPAIIFR